MSKSYHATRRDLKGKTKKEIDKMINDRDAILHELAEKSRVKKEVKKQRKTSKRKGKTKYNNIDDCHFE